MYKHLFVVFVAILLLASCSSTSLLSDSDTAKVISDSTIVWSDSWNEHCDAYNFTSNQQVALDTTLGSMYTGDDFDRDIDYMDIAISTDIGEASGLEDATVDSLYMWFESDGVGVY